MLGNVFLIPSLIPFRLDPLRVHSCPCPDGFRNVRVHDLKHTYGYRLRTAGVHFEDGQLLVGHKAAHVTTHSSAADIGSLINASEKVCDLASRTSLGFTIDYARPSAP